MRSSQKQKPKKRTQVPTTTPQTKPQETHRQKTTQTTTPTPKTPGKKKKRKNNKPPPDHIKSIKGARLADLSELCFARTRPSDDAHQAYVLAVPSVVFISGKPTSLWRRIHARSSTLNRLAMIAQKVVAQRFDIHQRCTTALFQLAPYAHRRQPLFLLRS